MNLKEKMAEAKGNLAAVKEAVESGEKDADELKAAIEEVNGLQEKLDAAAEAKAMLAKLGNSVERQPADIEEKGAAMTAKNIGEFAAGYVKEKGLSARDKFGVTTPEFKAASVMTLPSTVSAATTDVEARVIEGYRRPLMIADLFGSEQISGNAITFYRESATVEGGVGKVAEGTVKPLTSFGDPEPVTVALQKIGAHYKESSELIEDTPWLASSINGRGMYLHELFVDGYLKDELSKTSGLQSKAISGSAPSADEIFAAMMDVQDATGFAADAIVINPTDYQALRLAKDGNQQYYGGGYFYGAYGNTGISEQPPLWGLRTVITSSVAAGECFVGAFKLGGSVIRKGGVSVNIANTNEDDFIKNVITILIEERLALAVRYPGAFVKLSKSA